MLTRDNVFNDRAYSMYTALELGFSTDSEAIGHEMAVLMRKHHGEKPTLFERTPALVKLHTGNDHV